MEKKIKDIEPEGIFSENEEFSGDIPELEENKLKTKIENSVVRQLRKTKEEKDLQEVEKTRAKLEEEFKLKTSLEKPKENSPE